MQYAISSSNKLSKFFVKFTLFSLIIHLTYFYNLNPFMFNYLTRKLFFLFKLLLFNYYK